MISIIIPTFNEADNITNLINQISLALKGKKFKIIVVDDDSPDKTWAIVKKISKKNPQVKLIHRKNERGLTSAINIGIKTSRGAVIGWLDADLSHPPKLLTLMLSQLKSHDAVIASRYIPGAKDNRGLFFAVVFSRFINLLAQYLLYKDITDYTSGYILVRKKFLNKPLLGDYGEYFINLLFDLKQQQARIIEVPYISYNRQFGQSKTGTNLFCLIKRGYKYLYTIISLWLKKLFS